MAPSYSERDFLCMHVMRFQHPDTGDLGNDLHRRVHAFGEVSSLIETDLRLERAKAHLNPFRLYPRSVTICVSKQADLILLYGHVSQCRGTSTNAGKDMVECGACIGLRPRRIL